MSTMNISLPEELRQVLDQQVSTRGYTSSSEYVRELIRREQDKEALRALILEGAASPLTDRVADPEYFDGLRARAREWADAAGASPASDKAPRRGKRGAGA